MTLTIENIREGDFEKRQEILRMELEHKEKVDTITNMNRRYTSDTSREKSKLEELLKDKEFEVAKVMRTVEHLELTKEYLERELLIYKQRVHGHDASIKTVGFNFSVTQKDMSKKIASLQNTVMVSTFTSLCSSSILSISCLFSKSPSRIFSIVSVIACLSSVVIAGRSSSCKNLPSLSTAPVKAFSICYSIFHLTLFLLL